LTNGDADGGRVRASHLTCIEHNLHMGKPKPSTVGSAGGAPKTLAPPIRRGLSLGPDVSTDPGA
jgi:hypothetical protein